eukprot:CAMPEP_0197072098 /NCGR_PEP_ID=MMETSP1384-20130603/209926_1 /TAXON_ID=29189 /ORGANISM="Ammonia sp." /LENGTH=340 /DNA_ID=CAMNT_0042510913 /DNA_START=96 /DNA_END=1119 /DNA_ORIENTATION=+
MSRNQSVSLIRYDDQIIDEDGNPICKTRETLGNENENHLNDQETQTKKQSNVQLREILNCVLPPVKLNEYHEYKQVSSAAASREEVIALQTAWDDQLQLRQARESGICAIREELNEQAFNELIRQISISLPERGLLALPGDANEEAIQCAIARDTELRAASVKLNEYHEYKQVSSAAASREEVIALQTAWDDQLQLRQARESGICAIREELNEQAFNELIRQISISLPERGLLALRIRDEAKMTIQTYHTLYQSSLAFGMRKCIQSQSEIEQLQQELHELQAQKATVARKLKELRVQKQNVEKLCNEQKQIDQKAQTQEMEFLKHQQEALQSYLKTEFGK